MACCEESLNFIVCPVPLGEALSLIGTVRVGKVVPPSAPNVQTCALPSNITFMFTSLSVLTVPIVVLLKVMLLVTVVATSLDVATTVLPKLSVLPSDTLSGTPARYTV